jgi:WD40 repeat protein
MLVRPLKVKSSYSVGFSPCGATCFTLARDVSLWDVASRKKTWRVHPFSHPSDAAFSPKGDMIAVKSTSGRIAILTTDSGDLLKDFENDAEGEGSNLLFSDCGQFIVDGSWDGFLTVRDASTGEVHYRREYAGEMLRRVHSVRSGTVWIIQHSPKATTRDQPPADGYFTIWTWPFLDGAPSAVGIHLPFICSSAFSEDGSRLAVLFGAPPRDLHVYELPSGRLVWQDRVTIGGSGSHLRFSRSGIFLASVQKDCVVHYCAVTGRRLEWYSLPYPSDVAYSPDGLSIALGSWNSGEIRHLVTPGNKNGESGRGDRIAPVTPPTPPGMRDRTGRFQSDH